MLLHGQHCLRPVQPVQASSRESGRAASPPHFAHLTSCITLAPCSPHMQQHPCSLLTRSNTLAPCLPHMQHHPCSLLTSHAASSLLVAYPARSTILTSCSPHKQHHPHPLLPPIAASSSLFAYPSRSITLAPCLPHMQHHPRSLLTPIAALPLLLAYPTCNITLAPCLPWALSAMGCFRGSTVCAQCVVGANGEVDSTTSASGQRAAENNVSNHSTIACTYKGTQRTCKACLSHGGKDNSQKTGWGLSNSLGSHCCVTFTSVCVACVRVYAYMHANFVCVHLHLRARLYHIISHLMYASLLGAWPCEVSGLEHKLCREVLLLWPHGAQVQGLQVKLVHGTGHVDVRHWSKECW